MRAYSLDGGYEGSRKLFKKNYLQLSVLLKSSGDSRVIPVFPLNSNGVLNGEIHLN